MISITVSIRIYSPGFLTTHDAAEHYRPVLSTIRSRRVMREEGATKRDDAGAGRASR